MTGVNEYEGVAAGGRPVNDPLRFRRFGESPLELVFGRDIETPWDDLASSGIDCMLGGWLDMDDERFLAWSKSIANGNGLSAHCDRGSFVGVDTAGAVLEAIRCNERSWLAVCGRGGDGWKPEEEGGLSRPALVTAGMFENRERSWRAGWARRKPEGSSPGLEGPREKERRPMESRGARCGAR